jgi:hypothetical protein
MHALFLNPRVPLWPFDPPGLPGAVLYRAGQYAQAERALARGKGADPATWVFQALTAQRLHKHDQAARLLARFEDWHRQQKFPDWVTRIRWAALLAEARQLILTPPPMPKLGREE